MSALDYHDIKLIQDIKTAIWDIGFDDSGDFILDDTFDISLIMSLFVDARAAQSEIPEPLARRGFWGDLILFKNDNEIESGSKLWMTRGRRTEALKNKAIDYAYKALQWLVTRNYAKEVRVDAAFAPNGIILDISITIEDNSIEKFNFKLWENGIVQEVRPL